MRYFLGSIVIGAAISVAGLFFLSYRSIETSPVVGQVLSTPELPKAAATAPTPDWAADTPEILGASSSATPLPTPTPTLVASPSPTPTASPSPTSTPTPTPKATPTIIYTPQMIDGYFAQYSGQYHVDEQLLRHIAVCESGYNTDAKNGPYGGMFQFSSSTWITTRQRMGLETNPDLRFNPEEAVKTAAFKLSKNEAYAWPKCG